MNHNDTEPFDIRLVIFDFDGVFTDNKIYTDNNGNEFVMCDKSDSNGLTLLRKNDIKYIVVSAEKSQHVLHRCNKLNIPCFNGIENKGDFVRNYMLQHNILPKHVCYVGNDFADIDAMMSVSLSIATPDSHSQVKHSAKYILSSLGGHGAVNEVCAYVCKESIWTR